MVSARRFLSVRSERVRLGGLWCKLKLAAIGTTIRPAAIGVGNFLDVVDTDDSLATVTVHRAIPAISHAACLAASSMIGADQLPAANAFVNAFVTHGPLAFYAFQVIAFQAEIGVADDAIAPTVTARNVIIQAHTEWHAAVVLSTAIGTQTTVFDSAAGFANIEHFTKIMMVRRYLILVLLYPAGSLTVQRALYVIRLIRNHLCDTHNEIGQ